VFEALVPQGKLNRLRRPCGVIARQRPLPLVRWAQALVLSAGTPGGPDLADLWRTSLESEGPRVRRAACARWFDVPLERLMAVLAQRALASAGPNRSSGRARAAG
jgi:hypothetical protein